MKKIFATAIIGLLILGIAAASTTAALPKENHKNFGLLNNLRKTLPGRTGTNGTFTGAYALKNDTGYVILGSLAGTYFKQSQNYGTFEGTWTATNGTPAGYMNGYIYHAFLLGQYNITGANETGWFIGLHRVNTTSSEFQAVSIVFTESDYAIRYAAGTYQETP